jgi:hypothetical protein
MGPDSSIPSFYAKKIPAIKSKHVDLTTRFAHGSYKAIVRNSKTIAVIGRFEKGMLL